MSTRYSEYSCGICPRANTAESHDSSESADNCRSSHHANGCNQNTARFALQLLPFSFSGLGLIALGVCFFIAEAFVPTSGALAIGGILAFVIGAVILVDTDVPGYGVPLPLIIGVATISAVFVLMVVRFALKARRRQVVTGQEELLRSQGEVMEDFAGVGWARVHGEIWQVKSGKPLGKGQRVRVTRIDGLTLEVEPESTNAQGGV